MLIDRHLQITCGITVWYAYVKVANVNSVKKSSPGDASKRLQEHSACPIILREGGDV